MKKILLSVAIIATSFTTIAQVGVGTTTPKGALQVTSTTSGVIIPQFADLTAIQAITKADGTTALDTDEQGMQVYNIAEKKNYLWDGTAWVSATGSAGKFVDDTYGNVVLDYAASKDSISYRDNGMKNFPKNTSVISHYDSTSGTVIDTPITDYLISNSYNQILVNPIYASDATGYLQGNESLTYLDATDTRSTQSTAGHTSIITTNQDNANSHNQLRGAVGYSRHHGSGTVNKLVGGFFGTNTFAGAHAKQSTSVSAFNNLRHSDNMNISEGFSGLINYNGSTGDVSKHRSIYFETKIAAGTTSNFTDMYFLQNNFNIDANYSGTITNYYDFHSPELDFGAGTVTNAYGIAIEGSTKKNYLEGTLSIGTKDNLDRERLLIVDGNHSYVMDAGNLRVISNATAPQIILTDKDDDSSFGLRYARSVGRLQFTATDTNDTPSSTDVKMTLNKDGNLLISSTNDDAKTKLEVDGYIKLGSSDTTGDATPQAGMMRYNTTSNKFEGYTLDSDGNGTADDAGWVELH
jgi:hypothetical protein